MRLEVQRKGINQLEKKVESLKNELPLLISKGLTIGLGASTKGNTLLQMLNLRADLLPFIAEVNRSKFGLVTPGTSIPIISEEEAKALGPSNYLVLPWHFREFFVRHKLNYQPSNLIFPLPALTKIFTL